MTTFSADVSAWVRKARGRMLAVRNESAQDLIAEMQEPGPSVANPDSFGTGHLPIDTGALRASLVATLNDPSRQSTARPSTGSFAHNPSQVALVIAGAALTDTIYATYSASYAPLMNARYGFRDLAVQNWNQTVQRNVRKVQGRMLG